MACTTIEPLALITTFFALPALLRFILAAGIVHSAASRSISAQAAPRNSPGRWNSIGANCSAARTIGPPL